MPVATIIIICQIAQSLHIVDWQGSPAILKEESPTGSQKDHYLNFAMAVELLEGQGQLSSSFHLC